MQLLCHIISYYIILSYHTSHSIVYHILLYIRADLKAARARSFSPQIPPVQARARVVEGLRGKHVTMRYIYIYTYM